MATRFDFAVYGPDDRVTTVIEAKARWRTNSNWAARLRRNMVAHSTVPRDAMFVLATPHRLYLWAPNADMEDPPTYETDASVFFQPYFENAGIAQDAETLIDPMVFEMIVNSWLQDLTAQQSPTDQLLRDSGLFDRIRSGRVVAELAA